jgi:hypothetical protein
VNAGTKLLKDRDLNSFSSQRFVSEGVIEKTAISADKTHFELQ